MERMKDSLNENVALKDLGDPKRILGIDLECTAQGVVSLRHTNLIPKLLYLTKLKHAQTVSSPTTEKLYLSNSMVKQR